MIRPAAPADNLDSLLGRADPLAVEISTIRQLYGLADVSPVGFWLQLKKATPTAVVCLLGETALVVAGRGCDYSELGAFFTFIGAKEAVGLRETIEAATEDLPRHKTDIGPIMVCGVPFAPERPVEIAIDNNPPLEQVFRLLQQSNRNDSDDFSLWVDDIKRKQAAGGCVAVVPGPNGVALSSAFCLYSNTRYAVISAVCTAQRKQGQGYASALVYHLAGRAAAQGKSACLCSLTRAARLYERLGFRTVAEWMWVVLAAESCGEIAPEKTI